MLRLFNVETGIYLEPIFISMEKLFDYAEENILPEDKYKYEIKIYSVTYTIPLEPK